MTDVADGKQTLRRGTGCKGCFCKHFFFFSSRRRHTRFDCDWSSDVCSSDLRVLVLGQHYRAAAAAPDRQSATLAADPRGHFFAEASVNDVPMRFVVDTGASVVVLSAADASRLGVDWRQGPRRMIQTANGATAGYLVKLDKVKVGDIELTNVDATVLEQGLGAVGLLGMSFLNRVEMQRDGQTMTLIRRF